MTEASSVIMQGITKTRRMLEQNRGVYMALRGGLEEQERDVKTLPPIEKSSPNRKIKLT